MKMKREEDALKAYTTILSQKGVGNKALIQREFVIMRLMPFIKDIPADGQHYRVAVDQFIASIDTSEVDYVLPVIREYFSFWVKDIKAIAGMSQDRAFDATQTVRAFAQEQLKALWVSLNQIQLYETEQGLLNQYSSTALASGMDSMIVGTRQRMARFLMLGLREVPHKQPYAYRKVVDAHLALFAVDHTETFSQQTFLAVAREFYYHWKGDYAVTQLMSEEEALAA